MPAGRGVTELVPGTVAEADDAFEQLYREHAKDVSRYVRGMVGDAADAEDVTQITFLNAYLALRRGERPRIPGHWLITIARNTCRARFRYDSRRPQEVGLVEEMSAAAAVVDDDTPSVVELKGALLELPPKQRTALLMRELEGHHCNEIARSLGISISAVETLLFRARRSLREQLEEQLSCRSALDAISKQAEGRLAQGNRPGLRAHLRRCPDCAQVARSLRARRTGLGSLLPVPAWLPALLTRSSTSAVTASSSSGAGVGAAGLMAKTAAIVATGVIAGGAVSTSVRHLDRRHSHQPSSNVPALAMRTAHHPASLPGVSTPKPAVAAATRRASLPAGPGNHQARPTARAPQALASSPVVAHISRGNPHETGAPAARADRRGVGRPTVNHAEGVGVSSHGKGRKGATRAAGNPVAGKAPRAQPQPQTRKPTSPPPARHAAPTPSLQVPAVPPTHSNGQVKGQGNGHAGDAVGSPTGTPGQSNAGGNGHR